MRVSREEFLALDLEAHALLADMPLHDVSRIDLPGGGPGRTMADVQPLFSMQRAAESSPLVRGLFSLRFAIGRVLGWDEASAPPKPGDESALAARVTADQRARSLLPPGTKEGPFELLYVLPSEAVAEVRNTTVHAASCMVLLPREDGYRFYWGIYVAPVSWITPYYMAAIEPFRRFIVYPTVLRGFRQAWVERFGALS